MSSSMWRRKPNKWHHSNKIRGYVPSAGAFSARTNKTGLPKQSHKQTFRPGKKTMFGGYPRTTGINRMRFNPRFQIQRSKTQGLSGSRHGYPFALGRGGAPGRAIALGVGSGGKTQALARRTSTNIMRAATVTRKSHRNLYIAGGVVAGSAAVGYAVHRRRTNRTRRNYKGQFAGSYSS